jgi:16S rRNA (guanine527-N7)-methyltransferase
MSPGPERSTWNTELQQVLSRGLRALGRAPDEPELARWHSLALLLERWSKRINLTGHRGALAIAQRLLLEAAALASALPPAARIADLGSGAGIPGLPIAICRPETEVWLVDSRERRHHFQRAAIRELGLANVHALRGRAEQLEPIRCDGVVSQAFAQPVQALVWMRRWMTDSGWLALATTAGHPEWTHPDLHGGESVPYRAPGGPPRALWIARPRAPEPAPSR